MEVLQKLVKLGAGWRTTFKNVGICGTFQLAKVWKVRDFYLVWSTDVEKSERRYVQIIRIWDLLSHQHVARTVQCLEKLFSIYTDNYLDHCRRVQTDGYVLFIFARLYTGIQFLLFLTTELLANILLPLIHKKCLPLSTKFILT